MPFLERVRERVPLVRRVLVSATRSHSLHRTSGNFVSPSGDAPTRVRSIRAASGSSSACRYTPAPPQMNSSSVPSRFASAIPST